jgi:hypothetical protein
LTAGNVAVRSPCGLSSVSVLVAPEAAVLILTFNRSLAEMRAKGMAFFLVVRMKASTPVSDKYIPALKRAL